MEVKAMVVDLESIVQQEKEHIDARTAEILAEKPNAAGVIVGCGQLIQCRQRYQALIGEHTTVRSVTGLGLLDRLDEQVVRGMHRITRDHIERCRPAPAAAVRSTVEKEFVWLFDVEFPVADMVMRSYVSAMNHYAGRLREQPPSSDMHERIAALVLIVDARLGRYVAQRDTPVHRHHSDVAREYAVVARLGCHCPADGPLEVEQQSLHTDGEGGHYDRLDVVCKACGARQTIDFPLPYFADLQGAVDAFHRERAGEAGDAGGAAGGPRGTGGSGGTRGSGGTGGTRGSGGTGGTGGTGDDPGA
jgi:hypothetical protein